MVSNVTVILSDREAIRKFSARFETPSGSFATLILFLAGVDSNSPHLLSCFWRSVVAKTSWVDN